MYIVPTPIGNLTDITQRALDVLSAVDWVAAEDTRHSGKLLSHYGIETATLAYHDHVEATATALLVAKLTAGESVALISDAGTPLVSDPGYRLVRAVQDAGFPVIPLPGPCAAIAALSASGLATDRFTFEGFLPAKSSQRRQRLSLLRDQEGTHIFYEAPHRIIDMLEDALEIFGPEREAVLARELTKSFETIRRMPLVELLAWVSADSNQRRGEQVVLIAPPPKAEKSLDPQSRRLLERLAAELPPRKAAAIVAEVSGLKARTLYDYLLSHRAPD